MSSDIREVSVAPTVSAKFAKAGVDGILTMANGSSVSDTLTAHDLEQQITSQTGGGVLVLTGAGNE